MATSFPTNARPRVHVIDPRAWAFSAGTDFWLMPGTTTALITSGTAGQVLSEFGWTTTSLGYTGGSGADFLSSADKGTPNSFLFNASGDTIKSPAIFGDWQHQQMAAGILGYAPTQLHVTVIAAFTTNSDADNQTAFGLLEDGGSPDTQADHLAGIYVGGGNVFAIDNDGAIDNGAAKDTAYHLWEIVVTFGGSTEWFIDGVSQGSIATKQDEWPGSFFAHTLTTNRIALGMVHIYYE